MPIIIRNSGVGTYGAFVLWPTALSLIFAFSYFGVGYSYRRKLVSAPSPSQRRQLFEPQFTYQLLILSILAIALLMSSRHFAGMFTGAPSVTPWILVAWLGAQLLYFQTQEFFRNTGRFAPYNACLATYTIACVAIIAICGAMRLPMTVATLLLITVLARVVASLPLAFVMLKDIGLPRLRLPLQTLASDIRLGWPLLLDTIFTVALSFGDRYLIAFFLSVDDVGRYQPGYQLASLLIFIPRCGEILLMPTLARLIDGGNKEGAEHLVNQFIKYFIMIAVPFVMGSLLMGPSLVALLSTRDVAEAGRWVVPLVAIGALFYGVALLCYQAAYVVGVTRLVFTANMLGAVLNLTLNTALLWATHNIAACAVTAAISYAATCYYVVRSLRKSWHIRLDRVHIYRSCLAALCMGFTLWLLGFRFGATSHYGVAETLGAIAIGAIVYALGLFALGGLELSELASLRRSVLQDKTL